MRLQNKVVIITGGGTGIGKAIAAVFAAEGASVVITGRNILTLNSTVNEIESNGGKAAAIATDVSSEAQVKRLVAQTINKYGQIDILVNNHTYTPSLDTAVVDMPVDYWTKALEVNLTGTMMLTKEVVKQMIPRRTGSIVNISSIAGVTPDPDHSAYSTSKWGIIGFTASLAGEVGQYNIRANCVSPAGTLTEGFQNGMASLAKEKSMTYDEFMHKMLQSYALKRLVKPSEVATAALFLASDDASAVTGQNLIVSCGFQVLHPGMVN